jgi:zinc protease
MNYNLHKKSVLLLSILIGVLITSTSFGQTMNVTEKVLPNGLKVLLKEEHKAPVVTFQVWYKVGSRNEQLGTTGMSHLLEHMMFNKPCSGTAGMTTPLHQKIIPLILRLLPRTA